MHHSSLDQHSAIQHLRHLHPQLDSEQLLAIAYEALHPLPQLPHRSTSAIPVFPPLSVVACPGSGKTLTLAARIAFFVAYHGVPASRILAITFTKRAKAELLDRVACILQHERTTALSQGRQPPSSEGLLVCTFGSLAFRYIQRYAHKFGWQSSMRVLKHDNEMQRTLRDIVEHAQAAARQKMTAAKDEEYQIREEKEQAVKAEQSGHRSRWDDDLDEDEMMKVLDEVESQRPGNPPPSLSTTAAQQPRPPAALPSLTLQLAHKPLQSTKELNKLVTSYCQHISRVRLRAGLILKPRTGSSAAYLHTSHNDASSDCQRLSEEDDVILDELLRAYDAKLYANAQLDRGDLIPALLALLRVDEAVLREVQSEWRAVFVDEVQDSSRSDIALLLALAGCERWKEVERSGQSTRLKPIAARPTAQPRSLTSHLCLVGDPQQCIYGFRGVDTLALDVVSTVLEQYGLVKLRLSSNYRSTQHIVNTAVAIIASSGAKQEQRKRKNDEVENGGAAKQAEQQPAKKPALTAPLTKASYNTLPATGRTVPSVAKPGLARLHTTPSSSLHPCPTRPAATTIPAPPPPPSMSMRTTNEQGERVVELLTDSWRQELRCIVDHIRALTSSHYRRSQHSDRHSWSAQHTYSHTDIAILVRINRAAGYIKRELRTANVPISRLSPEDESESEDGSLPKEDGVQNGVHVLTVHKAKGLEWPVVFVTSFSEGNMPLENPYSSTSATHTMPPGADSDESGVVGQVGEVDVKLSEEDAAAIHDHEECRVAYVAVTRARRLLFLCHSRVDDHCKQQSPSRYLSYIPAELRRVQDECVKVEVAGGGARTSSINVFLSALAPTGAVPSLAAAIRGKHRQMNGRPATRTKAATVRRQVEVGVGTRTAIPSEWTTAARWTGNLDNSDACQSAGSAVASDSEGDTMWVGFKPAPASSFKHEPGESVQIEQE